MPKIFSFSGLLEQDGWWQPAQQPALPLWAMEESHRRHTHAFLLRHWSTILADYPIYSHFLRAMGEAPRFTPPPDPDRCSVSEANRWLDRSPLLRGLLSHQEKPQNLTVSTIEVRPTFVLPISETIPIAKRPFALLSFGDFHLQLFPQGSGGWEWRLDTPWSEEAFPLRGVADCLADGRNTDVLTSTLWAASLAEFFQDWASRITPLLLSWPSRSEETEPEALAAIWSKLSEEEPAWTFELDRQAHSLRHVE